MRPSPPFAAAALVLALAGCSTPEPGSPMPTGAPPTTAAEPDPTSTTTTPAPSPTAVDPVATPAPTLPPEATTNDAAGAEAFVRYWYDALNYAYATGDVTRLVDASSPECEACEGLEAVITNAYAEGGRIEGGFVRATEVVAPTPDGTGAVLLSVVFDQAASRELDSSGSVVDEQTSSTQVSQSAIIQRSDELGQWLMFGLAR